MGDMSATRVPCTRPRQRTEETHLSPFCRGRGILYSACMPCNDGLVLVQHAVSCARICEQGGNMGTARGLSHGRRNIKSRVRGHGGFVAKQGRLGCIGRRRHRRLEACQECSSVMYSVTRSRVDEDGLPYLDLHNMALALFAWLVLQSPFSAKSHRQGASLNSEAPKPRRIIEHCVFCQAYSSNRDAFDIVWEVRRRHLYDQSNRFKLSPGCRLFGFPRPSTRMPSSYPVDPQDPYQ